MRLISITGEQLGVVTVREALAMAEEQDVDLVEISPTAKPPVCKLMDFGKYKYEQAKKRDEAKKKQKQVHLYAQEKDLELELYALTQITIDSLLLLYLKVIMAKNIPLLLLKKDDFLMGK